MTRIEHPSVSFEVTAHCNLKCAHCDHASPWMQKKFLSVPQFMRDVERLASVFHADEIRFAGGEPLQHADLAQILQIARRSGVADGIVILTNGLLLNKISDEVFDLTDCMVVSLYPGVWLPFDLAEMEALARDHGTKIVYDRVTGFRQMLVYNRIENDQAVDAVFRSCFSSVNCHTVYEGKYFRCSRSNSLSKRMSLAGRSVNEPGEYVDLFESRNLEADLRRYIGESTPLEACRYCLGNIGQRVPAKQLTKAEIRQEMAEHHENPEDLLDRDIDFASVETPPPLAAGWWRLDYDIKQQEHAKQNKDAVFITPEQFVKESL